MDMNDLAASDWITLAQKLFAIQEQVKAGADPLAAACFSLRVVVNFLDSYPSAISMHPYHKYPETLTHSLHALQNALWDRINGGRPALLFDRPTTNTRPTSATFNLIRANSAAGLQFMHEEGAPLTEASCTMAALLATHNVRYLKKKTEGLSPIAPADIIKWRNEIRARPKSDVEKLYKLALDVCHQFISNFNAEWRPKMAPTAAESIIQVLVMRGCSNYPPA